LPFCSAPVSMAIPSTASLSVFLWVTPPICHANGYHWVQCCCTISCPLFW
jgi:hypothetical protein